MMILDCDPDPTEETTYGYCAHCECNVGAVKVDFGIGGYEYWGSREVHHDWSEVCPRCEGDLAEPKYEEEEV
jgi:hypothetical protein